MDGKLIVQPEGRKDLMRLRPLWSNIAQDIVMTNVPNAEGTGPLITPQEICENYNITANECLALLKLPEFRRLVKDYRKRVDAMGDNASITLRAQMLASSLMETVYLDVMKQGSDTKDRIKVMERLFQYGGLDPATNGQNKQKSGDGGGGNAAAIGQVIINVPAGIPGMEHVQQRAPVTLDAEVQSGD